MDLNVRSYPDLMVAAPGSDVCCGANDSGAVYYFRLQRFPK